MNRISTFILAIALSLGTMAAVANNVRSQKSSAADQNRFATNGAFRDGIYLGKLAAQGGIVSRPSTGRWSTEQDRASFAAGYRQGYREVLAAADNTHMRNQAVIPAE